MIKGIRLVAVVFLVVVAACGEVMQDEPSEFGSSVTVSSSPAGDGSVPATTTTTRPSELMTWRSTVLGPVAESASVGLAAGPLGLLVSLSEESSRPPELWFSADGGAWSRVAELPIERVAIGAPLVGVGRDRLVAVKVGDPEAEAFGASSELAVWTSPDGRSWTEADAGGFEGAGYLHHLQSTEIGWVVAGEYVADRHTVVPAIFWSADGLTWQVVARGEEQGSARSVIVGEKGLLVVGSEGGGPAVWWSEDGTSWSTSRLPAAGHAGEATAGAWVDGRWLVVGIGSETEPMTIWESPDGSEWQKVGQLIEDGPVWENRFGAGIRIGDRLALGARIVRFAHENFCFETDRCFLPSVSVLLTADGTEWHKLAVPPSDGASSQPPPLAATDAGALVTAEVFEGSLTVSVADATTAVPFEPDPPVPELSMQRAEWGQQLEPDRRYAWALYTHCGIGQLGEFNGKVWQLDDPREPVPPHLRNSRQEIYGVMILSDDQQTPTINFRAGGEVVGEYTPRPLEETRMCS